ncbi:hypothetical protein [Fodinicola acaciae]|uniref:hypothetical protein n=1 Tax=Fodinicola acaciae TaxID=2681555 RepID=UPI0013CF5B7C|nr:hypothetical protein [Fodinicola acaciae]
MITRTRPRAVLPLTGPVTDLRDYHRRGGLIGLAIARELGSRWLAAEVSASGLRGRGGSGFPVATKWSCAPPGAAVVCDDRSDKGRFLLRCNPYQVIEGMLIAAVAVHATNVRIVSREQRWRDVLSEMAGELHGLDARVVAGATGVVHTAETFAHLPRIARKGADWFRSAGTPSSPGVAVFAVRGNLRRPGLYELPLGRPASSLIDRAGGAANGGRVKALYPAVPAGPLVDLDVPLDYDELRLAGSALGDGAFVAYDDSACMVAAALAHSRSPALARIEAGVGGMADLYAVRSSADPVARAAAEVFDEEFSRHLGRRCAGWRC